MAGGTKNVDSTLKRVRDIHRPAPVPKGAVGALSMMIMKDNEVSNALILKLHATIICLAPESVERLGRKMIQQQLKASLHQVDRRAFQGLDKAARQADRDTILHPRLLAAPRLKPEGDGIFKRRAFQIIQQDGSGWV